MQFDNAKLKEAVLYACSRREPAKLGAVKLHKVLYFSDMLHYAEFGRPITGAHYRKRPFGPTCEEPQPALRELRDNELLEIGDVFYFGY